MAKYSDCDKRKIIKKTSLYEDGLLNIEVPEHQANLTN
jgi:hypothetical protein